MLGVSTAQAYVGEKVVIERPQLVDAAAGGRT
jgi:hypothetical protein